MTLHAFQLRGTVEGEPVLDRAVDLLLEHWTTRAPIGPCHYGIGTLFLQVEYPFRTYNLFCWVYVLSFFPRARADPRFAEAFAVLHAGLVDGEVVVRRVAPRLTAHDFCKRGRPSALATRRYREILATLAAARVEAEPGISCWAPGVSSPGRVS
jgi:hypothetical protein